MSYEGYSIGVCAHGHKTYFDVYMPEACCTVCHDKLDKMFEVDLTNGDVDPDAVEEQAEHYASAQRADIPVPSVGEQIEKIKQAIRDADYKHLQTMVKLQKQLSELEQLRKEQNERPTL